MQWAKRCWCCQLYSLRGEKSSLGGSQGDGVKSEGANKSKTLMGDVAYTY